MLTAIYARKSTEQNGVNDEEKSVTRQVDHAKAYATKKGWTVAEEHIYVDDGISGAEFVKRPGFLRLMNALKPKPAFQALIMSEEARLGREQIETAYALKQLVTAGVRVFFYLEDRERVLESPTDKIMLSLTTFADELEREKARQRTYDAMFRKAKAGHVTGGVVYGYDNVEIPSSILDSQGRPKRAHVELRINERQAEAVRKIFELYAIGKGFAAIAKQLNHDGDPSPRPRPAGKVHGWAPSSVRLILLRRLYIGEIVWNQTKKRTPWGTKKQKRRPERDWIRVAAPQLRIVPEALWNDAHTRLAATRQHYLRGTKGELWGRPANGIESKYLLTGLAICGQCGGSLYVRSRAHGKSRKFFYGCTSYNLRGTTVCANATEVDMEAANHAVLSSIERDLLQPEIVAAAIETALATLTAPDEAAPGQRQALVAERAALEGELARLAAAVATGGEVRALLAAMQDRETRREQLERRLAALEALGKVQKLDRHRLERELKARLADWQGLLSRHVSQTRQILRKLLVGRIRFTPKIEGGERMWEFTGQGVLDRLLAGILFPTALVSPTGFEPVLPA